MALSPAWAIEGGEIPGKVMRQVAWCATSGASGIITPLDLRVYALSTPGSAVNIRTGGAVIASTYAKAGGGPESYVCANDATTQLAVPGGLASQVTYYVILRIDDPDMNNGTWPDDPLTGIYCRFDLVTSGALPSVTDPYILLAKVVVPANTAAITNAMITDLRQVANPRMKPFLITRPAHAGDPGLSLSAFKPVGETFPNIGVSDVDIPSWATRMRLVANWDSVQYGPGNSFGSYWMEFGPSTGPSSRQYTTELFDFDSTGANQNSRLGWRLAVEVAVPAAIRGTTQRFIFKAAYNSGSATAVQLTAGSGVSADGWFLERADQDLDVVT